MNAKWRRSVSLYFDSAQEINSYNKDINADLAGFSVLFQLSSLTTYYELSGPKTF